MRFPVRVFFRCLSFLLIFFFLLPSFTSLATAQTPSDYPHQVIQPNFETGVPRTQHTLIQSLFLETLLAIQCQITGIDLLDPTKSCLGINLKTGKLGYAPPTQEGTHIGGLLGMMSQGIGTMYTPTFSSQEYFRYIASDFGIVKSTHAAAYTGFDGLSPVLELWKKTRDIAYYLLIIAFIFIGVGVMLRLKIDPRTVMTVQNQIPRVIICIILITFSYAFAGLMIDTMWAVTYMGVNKITEAANPRTDCDPNGELLDNTATRYILGNPFAFVNGIFGGSGGTLGCVDMWGTFDLAKNVSNQIARIEADIVWSFLFGADDRPGADCDLNPWGGMNLDGCWELGLLVVVEFIASIIWFIIVLIALIIALFRIWFELLKAYVMVLLYVILGPIWIVFGLLPKRPLGFEKWLRVLFANLAIFPCVVFILVGARVLNELFDATTTRFVPPLIGEPETGAFGAIIEFGMVLMAPQLLNLIREKLSVTPTKQTAAAMQTFNAGRAAAGTPAKQALKHWNKRDQYGNAIGPLAKKTDQLTNKLSKLPGVGKLTGHDTNEWVKEHYTARGYDKAQEAYKQARRAAPDKDKFDDEHKGSVTQWARNIGYNPNARPGEELPPELRLANQAHGEQPVVKTQPIQPTVSAPETAGPQETAVQGPAAGEPTESGRGADVTIRILLPGEGGEIAINPGEGGGQQVHDVLVAKAGALPDTAGKAQLMSYLESQRGNADFATTADQLTAEQATRINSSIHGALNPSAGPEGTA